MRLLIPVSFIYFSKAFLVFHNIHAAYKAAKCAQNDASSKYASAMYTYMG